MPLPLHCAKRLSFAALPLPNFSKANFCKKFRTDDFSSQETTTYTVFVTVCCHIIIVSINLCIISLTKSAFLVREKHSRPIVPTKDYNMSYKFGIFNRFLVVLVVVVVVRIMSTVAYFKLPMNPF